MTDRDSVLSRIREALRRSSGPSPSSRSRPALRAAVALEPAALVRTFREEAEAQTVQVHEAADPPEAGRILGTILVRTGARRAISWSDPFPGREAVAEALRARGVRDVTPAPEPPGEAPDRAAFKASAARADVGVTGADFALADTGTLVLLSAPGKSRSASLLPPVHVALLPASRILPNLPSLLALLPGTPAEALERGSVVTLVTGTSKTADIELTLVRGVHGPGEIHVIVLSDPTF
jgi:L-lactate dehydrogenase complex protein LldG